MYKEKWFCIILFSNSRFYYPLIIFVRHKLIKLTNSQKKKIQKMNILSNNSWYFQTVYSIEIFYNTRTYSIRIAFGLKAEDVNEAQYCFVFSCLCRLGWFLQYVFDSSNADLLRSFERIRKNIFGSLCFGQSTSHWTDSGLCNSLESKN